MQKSFQFIFLFFYNFTKIKIKIFECPKSIRNYEKKNAWNIRRLVDESFVPSTQRASVLYWRLSILVFLLVNFSIVLCFNTVSLKQTIVKLIVTLLVLKNCINGWGFSASKFQYSFTWKSYFKNSYNQIILLKSNL